MVANPDWNAIWLSVQLAAVTTLVLILLGTPLAWWLAQRKSPARAVVEALVAMPLILPPTVLGFYLLVLLGPRGIVGGFWESLGGPRLVFSFPGLVIGSTLFSLPFVVQPIRYGFVAIGVHTFEAAATLGAGPLYRFFAIALPLSRRSLLTAATLGFAHTLGEFGVVLMIGGSIPNRTRVVSIAIWEHVETLRWADAHRLSAILVVFSFATILLVHALDRRTSTLLR